MTWPTDGLPVLVMTLSYVAEGEFSGVILTRMGMSPVKPRACTRTIWFVGEQDGFTVHGSAGFYISLLLEPIELAVEGR